MRKWQKRVMLAAVLVLAAGTGIWAKSYFGGHTSYDEEGGKGTTDVVIVTTGVTDEGLIYQKNKEDIMITGYAGDARRIEIPEKIDGMPVVKIEQDAFREQMLEEVAIKAQIKAIPERGFADCHALKSISLPESVVSIGEEAFAACDNLEMVVLSENVRRIGRRAFAESTRAEVYYPVSAGIGTEAFLNAGASIAYTIEAGRAAICSLETEKAEIQLPPSLEGYPVAYIAEYGTYTDLTILHTEHYEDDRKICTICNASEEVPEEAEKAEVITVILPKGNEKKTDTAEVRLQPDTHPIKGRVSESQGIVTGVINGEAGDGYSHWKQDEKGWWLQYADGSCAAGKTVADQTDTLHEVIIWELVDGAWYAFGADGYAKSGWTFDLNLSSWFYVDIDNGMKTGWNLINGEWYYFNPVSDGTKGRMYKDSVTPDGYVVDDGGEWVK